MHKIRRRGAIEKALSLYREKLLEKIFRALKNNMSTHSEIIETANKCDDKSVISTYKKESFQRNLLLRECFNSWLMYRKIICADAFYKLRLLKKCVIHWQNYSQRKIERRDMRNKMDEVK